MTTRSQQYLSPTIFNTHVSSSSLFRWLPKDPDIIAKPKILTDDYLKLVAVAKITISIFDCCLTAYSRQENYITCQ